MVEALTQLTPGRYLSTPRLWLGLLFAAAFIVAAIPFVFIGTTLLSIAIALVACWLPARRAARINPIEARRAE